MTKIFIILFLFVASTAYYGQGKRHEKQNAYYVEEATKEFNLDEEQQTKLSNFRMDMVNTYITSTTSFKAGNISQEELKNVTKKASETFHNKLSKLTGKTHKEMQTWLKSMREKLKKT
ncbi:hypothetical protein AWE51_14795 [Aquimarina aggregata]|uniref:Uncharacterized protein n=1 Tax=Aquimarina aggregata TaxID=1642818 RepID=A0A162XZ46_9FLAO|nr:hypothetical protein [Aquimarina aggregata]KZS38846.1 hypothetical protein AWE51_14795 [Aquimarina aggregata]